MKLLNKLSILGCIFTVACASTSKVETVAKKESCQAVLLKKFNGKLELIEKPTFLPDGTGIFPISFRKIPHVVVISSSCALPNFINNKAIDYEIIGQCIDVDNNEKTILFGMLPNKIQEN